MSSLNEQINEIKSSTILSSFDDKITLLQWLKNLEKAIKESNIKFLDYVNINELANNKIQIEMSFDGLKVYSNAVDVLSQTDNAVTENSMLPVQSGAVYTSLKNAVDSIMVNINSINGNINSINGNINNINDDIGIINGNIGAILPLDTTPTENSTTGVPSGGVYNAIVTAGVGRKYLHKIQITISNKYMFNAYIYMINDNNTLFNTKEKIAEIVNSNLPYMLTGGCGDSSSDNMIMFSKIELDSSYTVRFTGFYFSTNKIISDYGVGAMAMSFNDTITMI